MAQLSRWPLTPLAAWVLWLDVHPLLHVGPRNRLRVEIARAWACFPFQRPI